MKLLTTLALGSLISFSVNAATDTNKTIASIGVQLDNAYVKVQPSLTTPCLYDVIYIVDTSTSASKTLYATLLTAYSQGKTLQRLDYSVKPSGMCVLELIQTGS